MLEVRDEHPVLLSIHPTTKDEGEAKRRHDRPPGFAYALTKVTGEPLLFKGDDFSRTDIVAAA